MRIAKIESLALVPLLGVALCALAPVTFAQDADSIRVESNQVLVPTWVLDKTLMAEPERLPLRVCLSVNGKGSDQQHSVPKVLAYCGGAEVLSLAAKDFHLFEDGKEQQIQSVKVEGPEGIDIDDDNLGVHDESSVTPRGKWSTSDLPRGGSRLLYHSYLIAYTPPESAEGSCHQIKVKVGRRNSYVFARSQYCKTQDPPDPLSGTKFGKQLEGYLTSDLTGKIGLSLQTGFFYTDTDEARVDVVLEFPWNSIKRDWNNGHLNATIGVMGMVYDKDRSIAGRFNDLHSLGSPGFSQESTGSLQKLLPDFDVHYIPTRYETQIDLPAGEYTVKVVLSDGSKFGRVEAPLTVDSYDRKELAISSIVLCKRFRDAAEAAEEAAAVKVAPKYVPMVSEGLQFTLAGDTRFKKGEPLLAYFEVYEPLLAGTPATTVQTRLRVTDTKTGELRVDTGLQSATSEIMPGKTVIPIAEQIAVDKLPAGAYKLEVQASDSAGKSTIWRAANFTVE